MFNTELGLFCYMHENWEELLTQEPYNLKISEDGPYVMFKYNQLTSDFNNPIVQEARGIIFKRDDWSHPVCWAFNKFFNYGQKEAAELDWSTAFVTEKVDGSLIKYFYDEGDWHIATNGTIDAFKADIGDIRMPNFGKYFVDTIYNYYDYLTDFEDDLNKDLTYMFELVGPYNRVVVPHDESAIYFLGARNKFTGEEFTCDALTMEQLGVAPFHRPKIYSLSSVEDCIKAAELKSWDDEGFVVCDTKFNRVKIKSPAYVLAHYARNNNVITRKHLIKIILANETEEFLCYASDYSNEILTCSKLIKSYLYLANKMTEVCSKARNLNRGMYAELVKTFPKIFQPLLFMNYENDVTAEDYTSKWNENKWETCLDNFEKLKKDLFMEE